MKGLPMNTAKKKALVRRIVRRQAEAAIAVSDAIAKTPEPGFGEFQSSKLLADYLAARGFRVEWPWKQIPTAFRAGRGKGRPVVGLLAEYDALPDCGTKPGQWGHGCGHNLLGAAAAAGAVAAAEALEGLGASGKVVVYGCPAEEILGGKVYMARDGAFAGDDAILAWHPWGATKVSRKGGAAVDSLLFEYFGKTAHGTSAHLGRSAVDGVMLLDVAANYLREHLPEHVRIHMCIRSGGDAPNVVPAYAKSWYYVRGKDRAEVEDVRKRLVAAARGAAMATGTRMKVTRLSGVYSRLENDAMADAVLENIKLLGTPRATVRDLALARKAGIRKPKFDRSITTREDQQGRGSTDEDNVSWLAPLASFHLVCISSNTTGHHREYAGQVALPFAHRGMLRAAEVLAASAIDLCTDKALLKKAKAEFRKRRGRFTYDPLVPKGQKPPTVNP
jgi:aminobenzoyl-glutamate utilization protein B